MKKIIQLSIFFFILISVFIFYKTYFYENEKKKILIRNSENQLVKQTEDNFIKNLKYEVRLDQNNYYKITSVESEINYVNNTDKGGGSNEEIVKMSNVRALILEQNNLPIVITAKKAVYNNSNYNTNFREDVLIEYMDYKIFADKMDLNFQKNIIKIFQNVRYIGAENKLTSDNIELNLITKEIDIFMDRKTDNVKIMQN
jgi:hypothetical protein